MHACLRIFYVCVVLLSFLATEYHCQELFRLYRLHVVHVGHQLTRLDTLYNQPLLGSRIAPARSTQCINIHYRPYRNEHFLVKQGTETWRWADPPYKECYAMSIIKNANPLKEEEDSFCTQLTVC